MQGAGEERLRERQKIRRGKVTASTRATISLKIQRFQFRPRVAHLPPSVREWRGLRRGAPARPGAAGADGRGDGGRGASAEPCGLHPCRGSPKSKEARASGLPGVKMTSADTTPGRFGEGATAKGLGRKGRARGFARGHAAVRRRSPCWGAPGRRGLADGQSARATARGTPLTTP